MGLPKYWAVKNDGSERFKEVVYDYMRERGFRGDDLPANRTVSS